MASGVATRYATALFELAKEQDALDTVAQDLDGVERLGAESSDLRRAIRSPLLSREQQERAVTAVAQRAGIGELTTRFLGVLARNRRLFVLPQVVRAFHAMLAAERGEVTAEVTSAVPLEQGQLDRLRETVSRHVGKAVSLTAKVDPALMGGLVVRIGSRLIDASLRTRLQQLEIAMRGVG
jgi:F-type H+-transporting ATPase subunit delta